jgi:hypothetical protein
VTRRLGPPIARPAFTGASSGSTRASALDMRRKRRSTRMNPPIFRGPTAGSGAAKASLPSRRRLARTALTASTGVGRRADSIPSTVATCRWRGGRAQDSAPVTRLARFLSRGLDRSGAPRKARTFAPRACRGATGSIRRRNEGSWRPIFGVTVGQNLMRMPAVGLIVWTCWKPLAKLP